MIQKYAFINAKVKARSSLRLSDEFFQSLGRTRSLPEAVQLFRDTPYRELTTVYNDTGDLRLLEKELLQQEIDLYLNIRRFMPEEVSAFSESYFLKYETDSLKFALRLWFAQSVRGLNISSQMGYFLPVSIKNTINYSGVINAPDPEQVIDLLWGTPYGKLLQPWLYRCRQDQTLYYSEWALDSYYYGQVLKSLALLDRVDKKEAAKVVCHLSDRQNLLTLLLFRTSSAFPDEEREGYFLEGGEKLNRILFQKALDMNDAEFRDVLHKLFPALSFRELNQAFPLLFKAMEKDLNSLSRKLAAGNPFTIGIILSWYLKGQEELAGIKRILNDKYYEGDG
jgi:vacuolar-type H+-ATPase subunit C/Vma6